MSLVARAIRAMVSKGYRVFQDSSGRDYNLNIVGIRSVDLTPDVFNDTLLAFWWDSINEIWKSGSWRITTDPGLYWLRNPDHVRGTAILAPGQYISAYMVGKHKGQYEALVQRGGSVAVYRDRNRDGSLDPSGEKDLGYFGINIHRASRWRITSRVDKWSAGCQVFADPKDFQEFMDLVNLAQVQWGNRFTYTLLEGSDLEEVV